MIDFGRQQGAQRGDFWEPKWKKNRPENDSKFKNEKVTYRKRLGSILGGFRGSPREHFHLFFWFSYDFVEISVFDVDSRPRAILDQK